MKFHGYSCEAKASIAPGIYSGEQQESWAEEANATTYIMKLEAVSARSAFSRCCQLSELPGVIIGAFLGVFIASSLVWRGRASPWACCYAEAVPTSVAQLGFKMIYWTLEQLKSSPQCRRE